jgi:regulator of protease activity HflC (stomatin/prohibitin superfamily)
MKTSKHIYITLLVLAVIIVMQSCVTIRPGEVGVKTSYGKMKSETLSGGRYVSGIFGQRVFKISTRIVNYSATEHLPTNGNSVERDPT